MKLRIRGNSIRIRVSQTELAAIADTGRVEDVIEFAPGVRLRYGLSVVEQGSVEASYEGDQVFVNLPRPSVDRWLAPDQVGIDSVQTIADGRELKILVEKDFTCLAPREGEDDTDLFPNPATR